MEKQNKVLKHFDEWKNIPINKVCKMRYSKDLQKRTWYQEWRILHIKIVNPISNYLKSKLSNELKKIDESNLTTSQLVSIIHKLLPKNLTIEDKVKIIEENKVRKHK